MIQNQQTVAFSEVCARGCDPTVNETTHCEVSHQFHVQKKADREDRWREKAAKGKGRIKVGQGEAKHAARHAYDGLMLFCMN